MGLPILNHSVRTPPQGPTVRALEALWQQIQARPLWAPPHFLTYLRLRARMRLTPLDAESLRLVTPVGQINDCASCSDSCCIGAHNTVSLRLGDIAQLMDANKTHLIAPHKPHFAPEVLAARPALRRHVASMAWRRFPVLKQNAFGACMALDREGRCSLYPAFPSSCARFPYALHVASQEIFYSKRCRSFWIHPEAAGSARRMQLAVAANYNDRIKDAVLLAYAPKRLRALGLMDYLTDDGRQSR